MQQLDEPDFFICLGCESPCYTFEWNDKKGRLIEALCQICGNDSVEEFHTEDEFMGDAEE